MDKILNLIYEYRLLIACVVVSLMTVAAGFIMGWQWVRVKAYSLMLLAKKLSKDGVLVSGVDQEEFVVNALYILLKKLKIPFVTKERLSKLVHYLYIKSMDWLDDGKLNNSIN